jgi:hypothetical protein
VPGDTDNETDPRPPVLPAGSVANGETDGSRPASSRDVDRKMKPEEFFRAFPVPCDGSDPKVPVIFEPSDEFVAAIEQDLSDLRQQGRISDPCLQVPDESNERRYGALDRFRPGDTLGFATIGPQVPLLVVGDVHGDSWSLAAALELARQPEWLWERQLVPAGSRPAVVLVGDLVDRGTDHFECIILALQRIQQHPESTVWIAGNHDIGHRWDESRFAFESELSPAEFADWLNAGDGGDRARRIEFGQAFLRYAGGLPRAVAFQSGLLATHGGVPHCDLFHTYDRLEQIQASEQARDDFTWIRVAESAPTKVPNRGRRGCELGTHQLVASVAHLSELLAKEGRSRITSVVRGHDHHGDRFFVHAAGFPPMSLVTLNTMGPADDQDNPFLLGDRNPCVGIYVEGQAPRLVKFRRPATVNRPPPEADAPALGRARDSDDGPDRRASGTGIAVEKPESWRPLYALYRRLNLRSRG